jgi:hypothetical protein
MTVSVSARHRPAFRSGAAPDLAGMGCTNPLESREKSKSKNRHPTSNARVTRVFTLRHERHPIPEPGRPDYLADLSGQREEREVPAHRHRFTGPGHALPPRGELVYPILKRFTVFNQAQCGRPAGESRGSTTATRAGINRARSRGADQSQRHQFSHRRQPGLYMPAQDNVQVPPPQAYFGPTNRPARRFTSSVTRAALRSTANEQEAA